MTVSYINFMQLLMSAQYYCSNISFTHINGIMITEMVFPSLNVSSETGWI